MSRELLNPSDSLERQRDKLLTIAAALMRRVEQATDDPGAAYARFQRAALLEDEVRQRTRDLGRALQLLNESNARLAEANRAAEAARQNLANAIETLQEGFALFDPQDILVLCNSRFGMHMPDVRPSLAPGLSFADYVHLVSRSPHLDLPTGERPHDWAVRRLRRHADRHAVFNVHLAGDRWIQVSEHRTADGGTVILQTDVTGIMRAERLERGKLLDDQARIVRATLDHIGQGVCIFDSESRLRGWNERASTLLAFPVNRLRLGLPFSELFEALRGAVSFADGMSAERLRSWIDTCKGRQPLRFRINLGEGPILDVSAEEMPDRGFVMSFTDVTAEQNAIAALSRANETLEARVTERTEELRQALERAERANATRNRFVAAAGHDLLQPLSAARLFVAAATDDALPDAARAALRKAENALDSVESLVTALLDISRLESGRSAVSEAPVPLGPMLDRLADEFAPLAESRGLRLRIRPSQAVAWSDALYLRRILQNLIGNALRYTENGGVLVGVRRAAGALRIEVVDTGPGIPVEEQRNVFREFHRLNARASASDGMGLGLAIVDRAAALLGHRIALRSRMGRGTRFVVTVATADPGGRPDTDTVRRLHSEGADRLVLLAEPDTGLRQALARLIEGWGCAVLEAGSGTEAQQLLAETGLVPDLAVVALDLGAAPDGLAIVAALRAANPALGACLIAGEQSAARRAAAAEAGLPILWKPLDPAALREFVLPAGHGGASVSRSSMSR
ncbi:MAG: PAS-domain containing protein [Gemmobacter sp.]